jgi:hypothetical protein
MSDLKLLSGSDDSSALSIVPVGVQPTLPPDQGDVTDYQEWNKKTVIHLRAADCKSLVVKSGIGFDLAQYNCVYAHRNAIRSGMYRQEVQGSNGVYIEVGEISDGVKYLLIPLVYVNEEIENWDTGGLEHWEGLEQDPYRGYGVWKLDEPYKGQK